VALDEAVLQVDRLNQQIRQLYEQGRDQEALGLAVQARDLIRRHVGEGHPYYADSLDNLARVHRDMGNYATAEPLFREAREIRRSALGEGHPDYADSLDNLAVISIAAGRVVEAIGLMEQAVHIYDRMIGEVLAAGSERQSTRFLSTVSYNLHGFLSLVLQCLSDTPAAVRAALDLVLRRKAIAAEAVAIQRDGVLGGKYAALEPKLRSLAALRMRIARQTLAGPGRDSLEAHQRVLAAWNAQRVRLEIELAREIPETDLEQKLRSADHRRVALGLPQGACLVEFVRFNPRNFHALPAQGEPSWKPARYVAFVLLAGEPDGVQMIDLGEADPIDRLIADFRAGITAEAETDDCRDMTKQVNHAGSSSHSDVGSALRIAVFDRVAPAFRGRSRLLIAPDGDLTRLPFEVLAIAGGRCLIDDYQISYLSCGRDVLRFGVGTTGRPGHPLVVADPDFDLDSGSGPPLSGIHPSQTASEPKCGDGTRLSAWDREAPSARPPQPLTPTHLFRSASRLRRDLRAGAFHFGRLPGTRAEGQAIADLLGFSLWLDDVALEGLLKAVCRSPRILHLATHGFFLADIRPELGWESLKLGAAFLSADGRSLRAEPLPEDPMLRSGLALAGANTWLRGGNPPEEAEDGLLTAEDVTGLDLLDTELVVLSACETGLGQVHVGEGVFGLRRAFVLAGARTLVMSMWKVPDEPTRELMEDFYGRLLAGQGRAEALRQAQLTMKAKYPNPFYWGAFICQGDPSPLGPIQPGTTATGSVPGTL
jgi:tetratricopeptide (TPR) repeat protein